MATLKILEELIGCPPTAYLSIMTMKYIFILCSTIFLLTGCASGFVLPQPQCQYIDHAVNPCNDAAVLSSQEDKKWSCQIPNPHYTADDQRCRWDK